MRTIWKSARVLASIPALAAIAVLSAGVLPAADWNIETVDITGPAYYTSLKADKDGNLHAAYVPDIPGHPLRYAFWDHAIKKWFTMQVTTTASFCTLVLDSKQRPHISYADHGTGLGAKLRHAYWDGKWNVEAIDIQPGAVVAYYTSMAFDPKDNPILSFYDYADPSNNFRLRLRSVFRTANYWQVMTVDPSMGSGKFNSIAIDSQGHPHIAYANVRDETSSLRYASWNGTAWTTEVLEGKTGRFPVYSVSMVLDKNDNPHIVYTNMETRIVKYATRRAGIWQTTTVDTVPGPAYPDRNGIALDGQGNPYISYYDEKFGTLKVAFLANGKWFVETVDRDLSGFTSSLAIAGGDLWVSYADNQVKTLKVAHRGLQNEVVSVSKAGVK
jgi:hypothetical protein